MAPDLKPDVPLLQVVLYAALNPATIAVAVWLGRQATEKSKLLIAAFAGGVAGVVLLNLAALLHIANTPTLGRASGGVFVAGILAGLVYARIGFALKR